MFSLTFVMTNWFSRCLQSVFGQVFIQIWVQHDSVPNSISIQTAHRTILVAEETRRVLSRVFFFFLCTLPRDRKQKFAFFGFFYVYFFEAPNALNAINGPFFWMAFVVLFSFWYRWEFVLKINSKRTLVASNCTNGLNGLACNGNKYETKCINNKIRRIQWSRQNQIDLFNVDLQRTTMRRWTVLQRLYWAAAASEWESRC